MEILGYGAAILMGLILGLTGGGGSILTVPILVYLFQTEPLLATSYSLFIVGVTSLIGGFFYLRKEEVDLKTGFIFALPSFMGVYLSRHLLLPALPDPVFRIFHSDISKATLVMVLFAILMLLTSVSMLRGQKQKQEQKQKNNQDTLSAKNNTKKWALTALQGFLVGAVTGFVGAGGGFLIIPALVLFAGLPIRKAVGTSLFIIAANSLFGFSKDLQQGISVDWILALTILTIATVGLFGGAMLSEKIPEKYLKTGFGYFVLVMGFGVLLDQVLRLI
ncbi:sulfite exporter TauE/SafE family protein [Pseudobdellovibrio exovorus]|uniref:Probable membrane transporter protein n=1 Tax=Pseudobdellovibrio exovorus JSS TaxID=1184267 RepID=M4V915_9BACT|nr:sulfite exporter TauE/SafE family protein [Pseudobdellovibrio exovorus]AGH94491.1 putative permease [Pseudobdellovibrio exovorus JSS]